MAPIAAVRRTGKHWDRGLSTGQLRFSLIEITSYPIELIV